MVIFVGINPSGARDTRGRTMDRFREWCDHLGLDFVAFTNIHWDESWCKKLSTVDFDFLRESVSDHPVVLALGGLPSQALTRAGVDHFRLPHPSPLNRQINDASYIEARLNECKEYMNERVSTIYLQ